MKIRHRWRHFESQTLVSVILLGGASLFAQTPPFRANVPRTWDDAAMAALEVPLANPIGSPRQVQAEYYYKIPVRKIYKQYPVYAPGREPAGYLDWLKKQEPVLLWDDAGRKPQLRTRADWIKAGETVFSAPIFLKPAMMAWWHWPISAVRIGTRRAVFRLRKTELSPSCTM